MPSDPLGDLSVKLEGIAFGGFNDVATDFTFTGTTTTASNIASYTTSSAEAYTTTTTTTSTQQSLYNRQPVPAASTSIESTTESVLNALSGASLGTPSQSLPGAGGERSLTSGPSGLVGSSTLQSQSLAGQSAQLTSQNLRGQVPSLGSQGLGSQILNSNSIGNGSLNAVTSQTNGGSSVTASSFTGGTLSKTITPATSTSSQQPSKVSQWSRFRTCLIFPFIAILKFNSL